MRPGTVVEWWRSFFDRWHSEGTSSNRHNYTEDGRSCQLSKDEVFHILQTERRRIVLDHLRTTDGPVRLRDLAEHVAAREHDVTVPEVTSDQRQRVYISLYQNHLPKLDEGGVIRYDKDRGIVVATATVRAFAPFLDDPEKRKNPWPSRYAGGVVVSAVLFLVVWAGVVSLPQIVVGGLVLALFAGISTVHAFTERR